MCRPARRLLAPSACLAVLLVLLSPAGARSAPGGPVPLTQPGESPAARTLLPASPVSSASSPGDLAGSAVAAAGDVNGDGYSDYIVGSPGAASGNGKVEVYLGNASGVPTLQITIVTAESGSHFGASVACAGDVNGDGYDDIIIGQPDHVNSSTLNPVGKIWIYLGGPSGVAASPAAQIEGTDNQGQFGASVAGAGDVNGDRYGDIVVGAPRAHVAGSGGGSHTGVVYVFYGSAGGITGAPLVLGGATADQLRGNSVAGVGDVNGDGYDDIAVGAPFAVGTGTAGRLLVYHGSAAGLSAAPDSVIGGLAGEQFGYSVAPAGDFDGDGYADIVVGAPLSANGATLECGKAYLVRGAASGLSFSGTALLAETQAGAHLGWSVGCGGDANGDGLGDVIIGEPGYDGTLGADEGRATLCYGNRTSALPNLVLASPAAGAQFGAAVSSAGDLGADGFGDLAVGAPQQGGTGAVSLYSGAVATAARFGSVSYLPSYSNGGPLDAQLGASVAAGGDFDGDGFDDGLVGAPNETVMIAGEGAVLTLNGQVSPSMTNAVFRLHSGQAGSRFGASVAVAGDVNGDGYDDALVGAPGYTSGASGEGAAFLYLGAAAGLDSNVARTWLGGTANLHWGSVVAGAGDLNRDGYADLAIASFEDGTHGTRAGRVAIYLGGPAGPGASPAFEVTGAAAEESLGVAVAAAGDVNGDGDDDLVIGAPGYSSNLGRVVIVYGAAAPPFTVGSLPSNFAVGSGFGHALAGRGDVDGDGYAEVAVGAPYTGGVGVGSVQIFRGTASGLSTTPLETLNGGSAFDHFGAAVSLGDLSADGYSDLVVGAPGEDGTSVDQGALEVYLSNGSWLTPVATRLVRTNTNFVGRGTAVAAGSDLNGDGFADVISGAPGSIFSGANSGAVEMAAGGGTAYGRERIERQRRADHVTPIALEGRSDTGNSVEMAIRARTAAGRQELTLQYQIGTLAQPFASLPVLNSSTLKGGAPDPTNGVFVDMGQSASGFSSGASVRWRLRLHTRMPWFPYTPWLTPSGNAPTLADVIMPATVAVDAVAGSALDLAPARPNPAAGAVALAFRLPEAAGVDLGIYDVAGRRVRTLARGPQAAGEARFTWDGADEAGKRTPAGVYFARLAVGGQTRSRAFVLLR